MPFEEALSQGQQSLLVSHARLDIPSADLASFAAQFRPTLRRLVDLEVDDDVDLPETEPPQLKLAVEFAPDHVTSLDWSFTYSIGNDALDVELYRTDEQQAFRDPAAEQALLDAVPPGPWPIRGDRAGVQPKATATLTGWATADFVSNWLDPLRRLGVLVTVKGTPQAYRLASEAPEVGLSVTDAGPGSDWFNLAVTVSIEGEPVEYRELFTALATGQTHLILPSGHVVQPRPSRAGAAAGPDRGSQPADAQGRRRPAAARRPRRPLGRPVATSVSSRSSRLPGRRRCPRCWSPTSCRRCRCRPSLLATLRPYQELGFRWLHFLHRARLGGILADDMGLGKTLQVIALAGALAEEGRLDRADPRRRAHLCAGHLGGRGCPVRSRPAGAAGGAVVEEAVAVRRGGRA